VKQVPRYLDPEVLARVEGLHLRARRIVEGYLAGVHRSPYHGFSVEFAEHRLYAAGDDLRYLDWKVFGRTDKLYLKQYEEETNLLCHLLVDTSQSMEYRGPAAPWSKLDCARTAAATLAWLVLKQRDAVGLAVFDDQLRRVLRPTANPSYLGEIGETLEAAGSDRKTRVGDVLHQMTDRLSRRGIVVVLSDLFDDVSSILAGLKHLRHRRHDVVVMQVLDPAELDFPFESAMRFDGLEGLSELRAEPAAVRTAYLEEFGKYLRQLRRGCREQGVDYILLRSDQPLGVVLAAYLSARARHCR